MTATVKQAIAIASPKTISRALKSNALPEFTSVALRKPTEAPRVAPMGLIVGVVAGFGFTGAVLCAFFATFFFALRTGFLTAGFCVCTLGAWYVG